MADVNQRRRMLQSGDLQISGKITVLTQPSAGGGGIRHKRFSSGGRGRRQNTASGVLSAYADPSHAMYVWQISAECWLGLYF